MAPGARLIHHLFFSEFFLTFKFIDGSGLLWKKILADHAIPDNILVALMGKRDGAAGTAVE